MTILLALAAHPLVHLNALLNSLATVLLLAGFYFIKSGRVESHKRTMLAAFAVSFVFLISYLAYHWVAGHVKFTYAGPVKYVYSVVLLSHVLLAITVPFLASWQIYLGFKAMGCCGSISEHGELHPSAARYREQHIRLARITFPIWLYVSVTGVVVYAMLYHLWPPAGQ